MTIQILEKKVIHLDNGCWLWLGPFDRHGYPKYGVKSKLAHRLVFKLFGGELQQGLTLDHLCRIKKCVNPDHLEQVTVRENILRGEGLAARNSRKTHCINGHSLETFYRTKRGARQCRKCMSIYCREWRERRKNQSSEVISDATHN
jgi:hypothetical protein